MLINKTLFASVSPFSILSFEGEGEGAEGGSPTPAPAPTPTPAPEPSLLGGDDADTGDADAGTGDGDGGDDSGSGDGDSGDTPDGDTAPEGDDGGEEEAPAGAPEAYDFTEILGGDDAPQLNEALLEDFTGILKEHNLTQEQADQYMGFAQKLQQSWIDQITQAHVDTRAAWRKEVQSDPEIGGDKLAETLAVAKPVLDTFGSPELKQLINETGVGDHPAFVRFIHNLGVVNREHDFVKSGKPEKKAPFYDHPTSQR